MGRECSFAQNGDGPAAVQQLTLFGESTGEYLSGSVITKLAELGEA